MKIKFIATKHNQTVSVAYGAVLDALNYLNELQEHPMHAPPTSLKRDP